MWPIVLRSTENDAKQLFEVVTQKSAVQKLRRMVVDPEAIIPGVRGKPLAVPAGRAHGRAA